MKPALCLLDVDPIIILIKGPLTKPCCVQSGERYQRRAFPYTLTYRYLLYSAVSEDSLRLQREERPSGG